jgi:hypothetical protein
VCQRSLGGLKQRDKPTLKKKLPNPATGAPLYAVIELVAESPAIKQHFWSVPGFGSNRCMIGIRPFRIMMNRAPAAGHSTASIGRITISVGLHHAIAIEGPFGLWPD